MGAGAREGFRFRLTDGSVNAYGFRVKTEGMDIEGYRANPVVLYMHERGRVIGRMADIAPDGGGLAGTLEFHDADELSRSLHEQVRGGFLSMVSVGIEALERDAGGDVARCRLVEVSLVDIGANPSAVRLSAGGPAPGETLFLSMAAERAAIDCNNKEEEVSMEDEEERAETPEGGGERRPAGGLAGRLRAVLGLPDDATDDDIAAAVEAMAAEPPGRAAGGAGAPPRKEASVLRMLRGGGADAGLAAEWDRLDRQGGLLELKRDDRPRFDELFRAKFGKA